MFFAGIKIRTSSAGCLPEDELTVNDNNIREREEMHMFEKLIYNNSIGYDFYELKVWVEDEELHFSRKSSGYDLFDDDTISPISVKDFTDRLDRIDIPSWNKKYEDPTVLDGESWDVTLETSEEKIKKSGENAFPPGWNNFLRLMRFVTGDAKVVK